MRRASKRIDVHDSVIVRTILGRELPLTTHSTPLVCLLGLHLICLAFTNTEHPYTYLMSYIPHGSKCGLHGVLEYKEHRPFHKD